jgi:hypothetical protein
MEFRSVIQTADGNILAGGTEYKAYNRNMNPINNGAGTYGLNATTPTVCTLAANSYKAYITKVDKLTHQKIWEYGYDFASIPGNVNALEQGRIMDMVEDPLTKNITVVINLTPGHGSLSRMSVMEIEQDGDVVWQKIFEHFDGINYWTNLEAGALGLMRANDGTYYVCGATKVPNNAYTEQTLVVHFSNLHTPAGPNFINSIVTGSIGTFADIKYSYAWDLIQLSNGKIFLGALEDNKKLVAHSQFENGRIYEITQNGSNLSATLMQDMGSFNAYDIQSSISETKDGGFIFQSTKIGALPIIPNPIVMSDLTNIEDYTTAPKLNGVPVSNPLDYAEITRTINSNVYLAKYNASGTMQWENTYPYTNYNTSNNNTGDIFQRECNYAVLQHPDGGYMTAGNNSANFDDHIVLKTFNECIENTTWDYTNGTVISGNPTWTTPKNIKGMIEIPAGQTLTISGTTIKFADTRETKVVGSNPAIFTPTGIIVKPGGKLIIQNNALLTASCPNAMWDGIQIVGADNVPQTPANQGYVSFNDSKITLARVALGTGQYISHVVNNMYTYAYIANGGKGGGIIQAVNGSFINNGADVELNDYRDGLLAYNSYIKNCNFDINDDMPFCNQFYLEDAANSKYVGKPHFIKLRNVECVTICGCNIQNSSSDFLQLKGTGIYAIDASMNVHNSSTWVISATNETNFKNLHCAIETNTSIPLTRNTLIRNCNMTNVQQGISVSGHSLPAPVIVYNKIELNPNQINGIDIPIWGVHLTANDRYNVQENSIKTLPITGTVQTDVEGIVVNNRSVDNTKIYRNSISLVRNGIYAFGQNGDMTQAANTGLLIDCNKFSGISDRDIYLTNDGPQAAPIFGEIKFFQGKCNDGSVNPTSNTFSTTAFTLPLLNLVNTSTYPTGLASSATGFQYNHFSDAPMTPLNNAGIFTVTACGVSSTSTSNQNPTCPQDYKIPSTIGGPIKIHPYGDPIKMKEWNDKVYALMVQGGSNNNTEINNLRNELNDAENIQYNYWIEENKYSDLIGYLVAKPYKLIQDNITLANAYIIIKDYAKANTVLNAINTTNTDYLQRIVILKEYISLKIVNKTWNNVNDDFESKLIGWSGGINKKTNITSQNVLRIVNENKYNFRIPRVSINANQRLAQKIFINESLISIFPNPNTGQFKYQLINLYTNDLEYAIVDITGKIIKTGILEKNTKSGNISTNLSSGLYYIRVIHIDFIGKVVKLVIQ